MDIGTAPITKDADNDSAVDSDGNQEPSIMNKNEANGHTEVAHQSKSRQRRRNSLSSSIRATLRLDSINENMNGDANDDASVNSYRSNSSTANNYMQQMRESMMRFTRIPFSDRFIPQTTPEYEAPVIPESRVERVVQRLEERNNNRVHVPPEVKKTFLRMCHTECRLRMRLRNADCGEEEISIMASESPCILRIDVINMRNRVRCEQEMRSKSTQFSDALKGALGFRCHNTVLLEVFNRAIDAIDSSGHVAARKRRRITRSTASGNIFHSEESISHSLGSSAAEKSDQLDEEEWFYYKDFAFYSLKVESEYPWMRNPTLYSILVTVAFYIMTPLLWCAILKDENICRPTEDNNGIDLISSLYFASVTISTVGYGDITIFSGEDYVENWRIFIAVLYMCLSLVVSVVGLQAGLDGSYNPFKKRIDIFLSRCYDIVNEKKNLDKYEDSMMRMKWIKIAELIEIMLIFFFLNLLGVIFLRIFLAFDNETETIMSWMESFYWAVQTTTTVGFGDVETPHSFKWFLLFYLAISTYFVGNSIGRLRDLGQRLEAMQAMYLWEQQEATYEMLSDFSGRTDHATTEDGEDVDIEPEIDQYEFTIASLVLMGKITSEDVHPIIQKFKRLTKTNKITAADVAGPNKKKKSKMNEPAQGSISRSSSTFSVGKKIAIAFKEEVLGNSLLKDDSLVASDSSIIADDKASFSLPHNTFAIGIDDSKIQRKLITKFFTTAGIPEDHCTIIGDGKDEIMGFEDFVIKYMEEHENDFVLVIVDENLDVATEDNKLQTISGSACVANIRRHLPTHLERQTFFLIRSANDSSSDVALYKSRAHGFLPKAPIKQGGVLGVLAPKWIRRFPPSQFNHLTDVDNSPKKADTANNGIACSPMDIAQLLSDIDQLFTGDMVANIHQIKDSMHELKGDLLTLNSRFSVTPIIGLINSILILQSEIAISQKWHDLKESINDLLSSIERNFQIPCNTFALAIDDSQIQRKLLSRFFSFAGIPNDRQLIHGSCRDEIINFEDFAVEYVNKVLSQNDPEAFIFLIADENLDVPSKDGANNESVSGSHCVENIRKRLSREAERRVLALVRSANDSTSDISLYNIRAHGFLPKVPIRKERINEILSPIWYKRFPPLEYGLCLGTDIVDEASSIAEDVACTSSDILAKLEEIDALFGRNVHITDSHKIHEVLHELKGDLLTMTGFNSSMVGILGQINQLIQKASDTFPIPEEIAMKWECLRDRARLLIQEENVPQRNIASQPETQRKRHNSLRSQLVKKKSSFF